MGRADPNRKKPRSHSIIVHPAALHIAVEQFEVGMLSPTVAERRLAGFDLADTEVLRIAGPRGHLAAE
jgi:hypothetical protein